MSAEFSPKGIVIGPNSNPREKHFIVLPLGMYRAEVWTINFLGLARAYIPKFGKPWTHVPPREALNIIYPQIPQILDKAVELVGPKINIKSIIVDDQEDLLTQTRQHPAVKRPTTLTEPLEPAEYDAVKDMVDAESINSAAVTAQAGGAELTLPFPGVPDFTVLGAAEPITPPLSKTHEASTPTAETQPLFHVLPDSDTKVPERFMKVQPEFIQMQAMAELGEMIAPHVEKLRNAASRVFDHIVRETVALVFRIRLPHIDKQDVVTGTLITSLLVVAGGFTTPLAQAILNGISNMMKAATQTTP